MSNLSPSINKKSNNLVVNTLENKKVVWLSEINKYLLIEPLIAEIIVALKNSASDQSILTVCRDQFGTNEDQVLVLIDNIKKKLLSLRKSAQKDGIQSENIFNDFTSGNNTIKKYYRINNVVFFVEYESLRAEEINHPKFSHFEIQPVEQFNHQFKVLHQQNIFSLIVDGENVGTWEEKDNHFLGGKFSMQILQLLYGKKEDEWLGVFHAAGVSNGEKCIMFLGDSGNGKSTLSAILMANGFDVLSDDFLPVKNKNMHACRFPAAISMSAFRCAARPATSACWPRRSTPW